MQSFLKGGSPCSELVLPEALSRFRRRLRAELGSEAQDRLKVQGQPLAGRRWESEEGVQEERRQPCNCLQWGVLLGGEQSRSLSSCRSWWCSRLPGCNGTSFSGQHSEVALFRLE